MIEDGNEDNSLIQPQMSTPVERSYRGIKSDYDYRQWTVERWVDRSINDK